MTAVTEQFTNTILNTFGYAGKTWLHNLPNLIATCARRWSIRIYPPFPNLSYNYVAPARHANGIPLVIKLGVPTAEIATEIAALRHFQATGAARVYDADAELGVLLLEKLTPGTPLLHFADDDEATRIAARLMRQLWAAPPHDQVFPTVAQWGWGFIRLRERYAGGTGPLPAQLVETAESLFTDLLTSSADPVLLHGDLHHENILSADRQRWLAIDPKGVIGEPAYEAGALLRNPIHHLPQWPNLAARLARRLDILTEELALDRQRLRDWALAQAVLSIWWSIESKDDNWDGTLKIAEALDSLR